MSDENDINAVEHDEPHLDVDAEEFAEVREAIDEIIGDDEVDTEFAELLDGDDEDYPDEVISHTEVDRTDYPEDEEPPADYDW